MGIRNLQEKLENDFVFSRSMFGNGTPKAQFQIPVDNPPVAFVHDLFLTEKYIVVIEG